jgi:hypothetical protein
MLSVTYNKIVKDKHSSFLVRASNICASDMRMSKMFKIILKVEKNLKCQDNQ